MGLSAGFNWLPLRLQMAGPHCGCYLGSTTPQVAMRLGLSPIAKSLAWQRTSPFLPSSLSLSKANPVPGEDIKIPYTPPRIFSLGSTPALDVQVGQVDTSPFFHFFFFLCSLLLFGIVDLTSRASYSRGVSVSVNSFPCLAFTSSCIYAHYVSLDFPLQRYVYHFLSCTEHHVYDLLSLPSMPNFMCVACS